MALPVTMNREARAAAHPLHLVEQEPDVAQRAPAAVVPLVGSMMGASNTISEQLARIDVPPKVTRFLRCLERATFGWAGVHRAQGREQPGALCPFVLAEWVERTQMSRSQILHIRQRLVEDGLIWYEADEAVRGRGSIGWNLDVTAWKPLQPGYPLGGGTRAGAGRPRMTDAAEGVVNLKNEDEGTGQDDAPALSMPGEESSLQLREEQRVVNLKTAQERVMSSDVPARSTSEEESSLQLTTSGKKSSLQQAEFSSLQLEAGSQDFKMTTPALAETAQGAASDQTLRRRLRKKKTETPIVVSEMQGISKDRLPDATMSDMAQGIPVTDVKDLSASASETTEQTTYWPSRQTWEQTDLDYYQRVLRERDKERVALLTRLAHERIGVPLEKASYGRIGALAKQCGAALLVKHILVAAANHIDGDPLEYLTKLARGQHRKETSHAARPTAPTSNSQPYTAEEASALIWNTL